MKKFLALAALAVLFSCNPDKKTIPASDATGAPLRIKTITKDCDGDNSSFKDCYSFTYDGNNRVLTFTRESDDPSDVYVSFKHEGKVYADGEYKTKKTDKSGRLSSLEGMGSKTEFSYNPSGRLSAGTLSYAQGWESNVYDPEMTDTPVWGEDGRLVEYTQKYHSDGSSLQALFTYPSANTESPFVGMAVDPLAIILLDFFNNDAVLKHLSCGAVGMGSSRFPGSFALNNLDSDGDPFGSESLAITIVSNTDDGYPAVLKVSNEERTYTYSLTYEGNPGGQGSKPENLGLSLVAATYSTPVAGGRGVYFEFASSTDEKVYRKADSFVGYEIFLWIPADGDTPPVPTGSFNALGKKEEFLKYGPDATGVCNVTVLQGSNSTELDNVNRTVITDLGGGKYGISVNIRTSYSDNDILFAWEGPLSLAYDNYVHFQRPQ